MDFDRIKEKAHGVALSMLQELLPGGKLIGREYTCGDLLGAPGDSFRYNIDKHVWSDFATGEAGNDIISLVAASRKIEQGEAAKWVGDYAGVPAEDGAPKKDAAAKIIIPATAELDREKIVHPKNGKPTFIYEYRDEQSRLINYICRWNLPEGGKDIRPYTQTADGWKWVQIQNKRPLYHLPELTARPTASVMLVEGEKAVEAAQTIFKNVIVMSWSGGSNAVKKADLKPLHGRRVCLWPDNDDAGRKAMNEVATLLLGKCAVIKIIKLPADLADGWDAADALRDEYFGAAREPYAWVKENSSDWQPPREPTPFDIPTDSATTLEEVRDARHYDALGFDGDTYYFYSHYKKQHCLFKPHTFKGDMNLLELAPENFWRDRYPNGRGDMNFRSLGHALMAQCWKLGIFNPESARVRGLGVWWDEGRVVVHLGDKMLIDGAVVPVGQIESDYVYNQMRALEIPQKLGEPTKDEIARFVELTNAFHWENGLSSYLLRGWCAIAPICGALKWRPHIWITGKRGSGKTWILQNVVWPMIKHIGQNLESVMTSDTGVRNKIGINAIPVAFDEIEGESKGDVEKVQAILKLARIASSDSGAQVVKATQTGGTREYIVKSCFAFASIAESIKSDADESRITMLNLKAFEGGAAENKRFDEIEKMALLCLGDFPMKMFKRSIRLVSVIRQNAEVFARAGSVLFKSRRAGDQLGALLAGAYSLVSDEVVDFDTAKAWIEARNFANLVPVSADNSASPCLDFLLQNIIIVKAPNGGVHERTIGELCKLASNKYTSGAGDSDITSDAAYEALRRRGIMVERECILIANNNPELETVFKDSIWLGSWSKHLKQIPGADGYEDKTVYFSPGCRQKCTRLRLVFDDIQIGLAL